MKSSMMRTPGWLLIFLRMSTSLSTSSLLLPFFSINLRALGSFVPMFTHLYTIPYFPLRKVGNSQKSILKLNSSRGIANILFFPAETTVTFHMVHFLFHLEIPLLPLSTTY